MVMTRKIAAAANEAVVPTPTKTKRVTRSAKAQGLLVSPEQRQR